MLAITIPINIFWLPLLVIASATFGYIFRSSQIEKLKKQVSALEKEMLNSHAEILTLQQELARGAKKSTSQKTLVVSMKDATASEEDAENAKESNRKQAK